MGNAQKPSWWVPKTIKIDNLIQNSLYCSGKKILPKIVTGDDKWVLYDYLKPSKSWVDPGQISTLTLKPNIHANKVLLGIWWDWKGVLYYELLQLGKTITAVCYKQQLTNLSDVLEEKRPFTGQWLRKVILLDHILRKHLRTISLLRLETSICMRRKAQTWRLLITTYFGHYKII